MRSLLLTGFGAFEGVLVNPSGALASHFDVRANIHGTVIPVEFAGCADALDQAIDQIEELDSILCLGVHPGTSFRLEARAGAELKPDRPDTSGTLGQGFSGRMGGGEGDLCTSYDLPALRKTLQSVTDAPIEISQDAGGYVCERVYRHALLRGSELGVPALFLHVPPLDVLQLNLQVPVVGALLDELTGV